MTKLLSREIVMKKIKLETDDNGNIKSHIQEELSFDENLVTMPTVDAPTPALSQSAG